MGYSACNFASKIMCMKTKKNSKKTNWKKKVIKLASVPIMITVSFCSEQNASSITSSNQESQLQGVTEQTTETEIDSMKNIGVGPVKSLVLGEIDAEMVKKGEELFNGKCSACHKMDVRVVGPALGGITKRRTPEWIMNMILNPNEMTQKDPIAKRLLGQYATAMANQSLTEDEARSILEYFRNYDNK